MYMANKNKQNSWVYNMHYVNIYLATESALSVMSWTLFHHESVSYTHNH
jgi:hypothetical protein